MSAHTRVAIVGPVGGSVEGEGDLEALINTRIQTLEAENRNNFVIQSIEMHMSSSGDNQSVHTAALITYCYSDPTPGSGHSFGVR